jgi:NTE family protein
MTEAAPTHPNPSRTAVILGSSFLGVYAHAGFLDGLNFQPSRLAGASGGALAAAFHACGFRGDELRSISTEPKLRRSFFDFGCLWRVPGVATSFWATGIFSGKNTIAHLRAKLGDRDIADLPLDIAVTNLTTLAPEIRRSGPLAEIVMASCAMPGLFTIQEIGGQRYLDGGIATEFPFGHFLDDPSIDTIVIHRIRHEEGGKPKVKWQTVSDAIGSSHHATCNELHRLRSDLAASKGKRLIEIDTLTPFPGVFSNRHAPTCYDLGRQSGLNLTTP